MLLTGFISEHTGISGNDEIDESGNVHKPKLVISILVFYHYFIILFALVPGMKRHHFLFLLIFETNIVHLKDCKLPGMGLHCLGVILH